MTLYRETHVRGAEGAGGVYRFASLDGWPRPDGGYRWTLRCDEDGQVMRELPVPTRRAGKQLMHRWVDDGLLPVVREKGEA